MQNDNESFEIEVNDYAMEVERVNRDALDLQTSKEELAATNNQTGSTQGSERKHCVGRKKTHLDDDRIQRPSHYAMLDGEGPGTIQRMRRVRNR